MTPDRVKVLITGAAGHIGSALLRAVPDWDVTVLDDFRTGRVASLFDLPAAHRPVRLLETDLLALDEAALTAAVAGQDAVVHLAALTDAAGSVGRDGEYARVNAEGTNRLGRACAHAGVPLVFASTTSVYGPQAAPGVVDEGLPREQYGPQSPYARSKLAAEEALALWREYGLRGTVLRFGTIYGPSPGMRFHTAVNRFCWQAAYSQPITVWKDAWDSTRPYCALTRAVAAIKWEVATLVDGGGVSAIPVYNVLSGNYTVREVLDCIRLTIGARVAIAEVDSPILNQQSYEVRRRYGWLALPDESLLSGVARTLRLLRPDLARRLDVSLPPFAA